MPPTDPRAALRTALSDGMADALTKDWPGDTRLRTAPAIVDYLLALPTVRAALASQADDPSGPDVTRCPVCDESWAMCVCPTPGDLNVELLARAVYKCCVEAGTIEHAEHIAAEYARLSVLAPSVEAS